MIEMPEGYITESEAQYLNSKTKNAEKFNEVFKFYHETVPVDTSTSVHLTDVKVDTTGTSVDTLDPAPVEQKQEVEQTSES